MNLLKRLRSSLRVADIRMPMTARLAARTRHASGQGFTTSASPPPSPSRAPNDARRASHTGVGIGFLLAMTINVNASHNA
ncbi:uncharacterized protein SCHCODRAFT_02326777 [Schizophyllum commune H4-8]|uniref:uncharacterized protein n=1 Tax=Schizophyllum commune (strain H4-8 / FGSC 9210) TaxID=578458 RepID=UPI002160E001|nr:uncharacterized protein SCHCODRAFT_02326777 [Schizophyllum commune H4-8]KAI5891702.1 hypothetical protein SCHCODRAFT_02326777 [Schizophyllum commune H4-8]